MEKFHISQALNITKAQRIEHGVDLPFENDPINLLQQLKEKAVIVGVKNNEHPYLIELFLNRQLFQNIVYFLKKFKKS